MEKFRLKILTPEGTVMDKDVAGLYLRGAEGDLAVFAGHIPFVTPVKPGKCTVVSSNDNSTDGFDDVEGMISEGMLRVTSKEVLLMVRSWE
jgi:F-type H+-transporting ATPase subunit epsilon